MNSTESREALARIWADLQESVCASAHTLASYLASLFQSDFTIAAVGAVAGAYAGAIAAQRAIQSSEQQGRLRSDLVAINAAVVLAFASCNSALAVKNQHLRPIYGAFLRSRRKAIQRKRLALSQATDLGPPSELIMNYMLFPAPHIPVDELKSRVLSITSISGRTIAALYELDKAKKLLDAAILERGIISSRHKQIPDPEVLLAAYLGVSNPSGSIDREHHTNLQCIKHYLDDAVFFSQKLIEELSRQAITLRDTAPRRQRDKLPKLVEVSFREAAQVNLLPPEKKYRTWTWAFKELKQ